MLTRWMNASAAQDRHKCIFGFYEVQVDYPLKFIHADGRSILYSVCDTQTLTWGYLAGYGETLTHAIAMLSKRSPSVVHKVLTDDSALIEFCERVFMETKRHFDIFYDHDTKGWKLVVYVGHTRYVVDELGTPTLEELFNASYTSTDSLKAQYERFLPMLKRVNG